MIEAAFACRESINDSSGPNKETKNFLKLIEDASQPLYSECEQFSKLLFIIEMYHLECMYNMSDRAFDAFTKLFKRVLPKNSVLPNSFKQMQSIIKQLYLSYKKIDACPNDCILFWKNKAEFTNYLECNAARYKLADDGIIMKLGSTNPVPVKILHHFSLISRLKSLYMLSKTTPLMRWHAEGCKEDGRLRQPADAYA